MNRPEERPIAGPERWIVAAFLMLSLALRMVGMADPWSGKGFNSALAAFATAEFVDNWEAHGPLESRGMPYRWRVELADGSVQREWYAHHPVAYAWATWISCQLFGFEEWAVRLPWILSSLGLCWAVWRSLRRLFGRDVALGGLAAVSVVPLAAHYAAMPWVDNGILTAAIVVLVARFTLWLERGESRDLSWAVIAAAMGSFLDWTLAMALPALGLAALVVSIRRKSWRLLARSLWLPGVLLASAGVHALHMIWVFGLDELLHDFSSTWSRTTTKHIAWGSFMEGQKRALVQNLGVLTIIFACLGLIEVSLRARRLGALRLWALVALVLPGVLYVFLFPFRGANHNFMWIQSIGGVAALVGFGLVALIRIPKGAVAAVVAGLVLVFVGGRATLAKHRATSSEIVQLASRHPVLAPLLDEPRGVLVTAMGQAWSLMPYSRTPIVPRVEEIAELEHLRSDVLGRLEADRPVHFLFDVQFRQVHSELLAYLRSNASSIEVLDGLRADPVVAFEVFDLREWATR